MRYVLPFTFTFKLCARIDFNHEDIFVSTAIVLENVFKGEKDLERFAQFLYRKRPSLRHSHISNVFIPRLFSFQIFYEPRKLFHLASLHTSALIYSNVKQTTHFTKRLFCAFIKC